MKRIGAIPEIPFHSERDQHDGSDMSSHLRECMQAGLTPSDWHYLQDVK